MHRFIALLMLTGSFCVPAFAAAPEFITTPDSIADTISEDVLFQVTIVAADTDMADSVFYSKLSGPDSLTVDRITGLLRWLPTNGDVGDHVVEIVAQDLAGEADSLTFTLTVRNVNDLPVLVASAPASAAPYMTMADSIFFSVSVTDIDAGDVITYQWLVDGTVLGNTDAFAYSAGGETTVTVTVTATDGSADTVARAWTAHFVAAFPDSVVPRVAAARYYTRGTNSLADDQLVVAFTQKLDDTYLQGAAVADFFALRGLGSIDSAALSTGSTANDSILVINLTAGDVLLGDNDTLLVTGNGLFSPALVPAADDTAAVQAYRVSIKRTGIEYPTITAAHAAAANYDSIIVTAGTFPETLKLKTLTLMAAPGARPVIQYAGVSMSGRGNSIVAEASYGVVPTVIGFEFNGLRAPGDTAAVLLSAPSFKIYNCVIHHARTYLITSGAVIQDCELSNGGTGIYNRAAGNRIEGNRIHHCGTALSLYSGANRVVARNVLHDNGTAIYLREADDQIFRNNLVYHNTLAVNLFTSYPTYRQTWLHNTVVFNQRNGIVIQGSWGDRVLHNILYGNGAENPATYFDLMSVAAAGASEQVEYNLIGRAHGNLAALLALPVSPGNKLGQGLLFADSAAADFHLPATSPATDAGNELSVARDYDGGVPDLGAFGGPLALDTLMPRRLDQFSVVRADSTDTLAWSASANTAFAYYCIFRSSLDSAGATALVDTISAQAQTGLAVGNLGGRWFYAIQVLDARGYAGGFRFAASAGTPEIALLPDNVVDFGVVAKDSTAYRTVAVVNMGGDTLTVSGLALTDSSRLTLTDTALAALALPLRLAPGTAAVLVLGFAPAAYMTLSDTLTVTSDDPDTADMLRRLPIIGKTAEMNVVLNPASINFNSVYIDTQSARVYLNIRNTGDAPLRLDSVWIKGDGAAYTTTSLTTPITILPYAAHTLSMFGRPRVVGVLNDTLWVRSNDPQDPLVFAALTVTGLDTTTTGMRQGVATLAVDGLTPAISANPAAQGLAISFNLPFAQTVNAALYDAAGRLVCNLANGYYPAGLNRVAWNGVAAPGCYLVVLQGEGWTRSGKLIINR
jgi:hypothetical protein